MFTTATWAIAFFAVYLAAIAYLSWRGAKKTSSFASFAAGGSDMGVFSTALVAAAVLTSTATFAINPGYVYREGLPALLGFSAPVALGVALAFVLLGQRIRRTSVAADGTIRALTLSAWIGERFESPRLRSFYALMTLLLFSYTVLILVGAIKITVATLGVTALQANTLLVITVVGLTIAGGTHAHASTTYAKGILLLGVAALFGWRASTNLLADNHAAIDRLLKADPALLDITRPASVLFSNGFAVFLYPLVIGFALACQPHILVKALYVKDPRALPKVGWATGGLFLLLGAPALLVGLAARAQLGTGVSQDEMVAKWSATSFPAPLAALVGVILVAVAIGTLNALFLALGTTIANDVVGPIERRMRGAQANDPRTMLLAGRIATLVVAVLTAAIAAIPTDQIWPLGVLGVYAYAAAACPAVIAGCLERRPSGRWIGFAGSFGALTFLGFYSKSASLVLGLFGAVPSETFCSKNPNLTGAAGVGVGLAIVLVGRFFAPASTAPEAITTKTDATDAKVGVAPIAAPATQARPESALKAATV